MPVNIAEEVAGRRLSLALDRHEENQTYVDKDIIIGIRGKYVTRGRE